MSQHDYQKEIDATLGSDVPGHKVIIDWYNVKQWKRAIEGGYATIDRRYGLASIVDIERKDHPNFEVYLTAHMQLYSLRRPELVATIPLQLSIWEHVPAGEDFAHCPLRVLACNDIEDFRTPLSHVYYLNSRDLLITHTMQAQGNLLPNFVVTKARDYGR